MQSTGRGPGCNGSSSVEKNGHTQLTKWSRVKEWYIGNTCKVLRHFTTYSSDLQHTAQHAKKRQIYLPDALVVEAKWETK